MVKPNQAVAGEAVELPVYRRTIAHGVEALASHEWLLTNGLGGFAMGTPLGTLERRYHGLLVAALTPPVGRVVALSAMAERAECAGRAFDLTGFRWSALRERGGWTDGEPPSLAAFESFELDQGGNAARWRWRLGEGKSAVRLERELVFFEGVNGAQIRYRAIGGDVRVSARPLVALRDFHWVLRERDDPFRFQLSAGEDRFDVEAHGMRLRFELDGARFRAEPDWWRDFYHRIDETRGLEAVEDLWTPGACEMDLQERGPAAVITAWMGGERPAQRPGRAARLQRLVSAALEGGSHGDKAADGAPAREEARKVITRLVVSGEDFLVQREAGDPQRDRPEGMGEGGVSIIAGYPWFSDWGRDTMICIPGLLLSTGRFAEALRTLRAFAAHRRNGIIPNRFDDTSGGAHYNTVDASLWFLHACCEYVRASGDAGGFRRDLLPACRETIDAYAGGTDYNIRLDDGLIAAGDETTQLTWMDAQRDGVVFTPRHGKCVEINALWYSGLTGVAEILRRDGESGAADALESLARDCKRAFERFWRPARDARRSHAARRPAPEAPEGFLCDRLALTGDGQWTPVDEIRPNQVFAASLPRSMLTPVQARAVIDTVRQRLLTPHGVRTLDPADPHYRPRFTGPLPQLDAAYHNGTVWPWLLGPLAEAILRAGNFSADAKREARALVRPVITRTDAAPGGVGGAGGECLGHIAEVFDGDDTPDRPQRPGGCPAQAWSLAEALRISLLAAG